MNLVMALLTGTLFAVAIYLLLRRSLVYTLLGLSVLSHAANLVIFTAGGLTRATPPIVLAGETAPPTPHADPLPQALILTAIVISFGVLAFMMALMNRVFKTSDTDDTDDLTITDIEPTFEPEATPTSEHQH